MAEIVASAVLTVLFEKLGSTALKKMALSKGVHEQLNNWERSLTQIRAVLVDAAQKEISDESVKLWLDGLQHLVYDIDDVLDDLATKAMHRELTAESGGGIIKVRKLIPTCCTSFSQSIRMSDKYNDITTKLRMLGEERNDLGLVVKDGKSRNMKRRLESSLIDASSIVGRQRDKSTLVQKLLGDEPCDQNFNIVPIVGLGGVGKTTVARLLYNDKQVNDWFELKAWVCVSDEYDIMNISKIIFQSLSGGNQEFADLNLLQVALRERLSQKRFLLVLDDLWNESYGDWELLARPFFVGAPGSKIIITTRKTAVASAMGCSEHYPLQILSEEDALCLFAQHALGKGNFDSHPTLKSYGEGIVKKCNGLPLALIMLGRLLRTKPNEQEWGEIFNSEIWRLQKEKEIIPALRLSYHDLRAHLKQLFAYCSLFPKDYMFDEDELVLLWMAEGFLHESDSSKSIESLGHECFEELVSRSFFQHAPDKESLYVMHDLMNDLATFVAGDFFFRLNGESKADVKKKPLEKYRHLSFICEKYGVYEKFKVLERTRSLRTLLVVLAGEKEAWQRFYLSNKILVELLSQLPLLRVLSLSEYEISEVPESVCTLMHLRYLNLSRTRIRHLPEQVGNLYNLQSLLLCGCKSLETLPRSFSKLKNLRHLGLSDTPLLKRMPLGIGELKSLQTLSKVIIEGANGFKISELKDMKELHGRLSITGLDKVQHAMDAKEANLMQKRLSELKMGCSDVFDCSRNGTLEKEVFNVLKPQNDNLKRLEVVSYGGIDFPSWIGDPSFLGLTQVTISGCKQCTSLPPLGRLGVLKELVIEGMDGVKVVGCELLGDDNCCNNVAFPSLEILRFVNMPRWEVWSTNNGDTTTSTSFPCLRKLCMTNCPNLVEASVEGLPSLRVLDITGCGDGVLRSLVHVAPFVTKLDIRNISGLTMLHRGIIKYLGAVEDVSIWLCDEMRHLWESEAEAWKILVKLRKLEVRYCKNIKRFGDKKEDNFDSSQTSLKDVVIWGCGRLERYSCPNGVETLWIYGCGSIMSISSPKGLEKLRRLDIWDCGKLLEEEFSYINLNKNTSLLESVYINTWPNLKSFPNLGFFIHLTMLGIVNCKNLESFRDEELPKLTSLTWLVIRDCPSLGDSFPRGQWPPNLNWLQIGGLKNPISKWGPQNFPTSLARLTLIGGSSDDLASSTQLVHLLPASLTYLSMWEFGKMESLLMGLQHLTSLRQLFISNCPKINHLPEQLLPSLSHLEISNCAELEERCSRGGSYWPHISHIPCVQIDKQLI